MNKECKCNCFWCDSCDKKPKGCGKLTFLGNYKKGELAQASPCGQDIICNKCSKKNAK